MAQVEVPGPAEVRFRRSRSRNGGECRATAVAAFVLCTAVATAASMSGGESHSETRASDITGEHPRLRQAPAPSDPRLVQTQAQSMARGERRTRSTEPAVPWPAPTAPPPWQWRNLDVLPRRLDALEVRLTRIEAIIEMRLNQMVEGEKSRSAKEDLWRDQESRRMESAFDRLERRLAYMETRLAGAATAERAAAAAAAPLIQEQLRCQQEKLEESVEGVRRTLVEVLPSAVSTAVVDKLKAQAPYSQLTNNSPFHSATVNHQATQPVCHWAEDHVANISKEATKTLRTLKEKLTDEFGLQADNFVTKVGNMYSDLWQRAQTIESLLKESLNLENSTQRDMHEGFRTVVQQQQEQLLLLQQHNTFMHREKHGTHNPGSTSRRNGGGSTHGQHVTLNHGNRGDWSTIDALELGLGSLEFSVETLSGTVVRHLSELSRRMETSFRMLSSAQNLFLESCHRIQLGEPTLEARVSQVLERLLDTVSNRSQELGQESEEMKKIIDIQTNKILIMLENYFNGTILAMKESNEWLSAEIFGANQKTSEEMSILADRTVSDVIIGVNQAIKPSICSEAFPLAQDNSTYMNTTEHSDSTNFNPWKDVSSSDPDTDFVFPHVAAVVKNIGSHGNHSLVALFHQAHQTSDDFNEGSTNDTSNTQIEIHQTLESESININDLLEEALSNENKEKESQGDLFPEDPFLKPEEFSTTVDPRGQEQHFDHEINSITSTPSPMIEDKMEHKRSAKNVSDTSLTSNHEVNVVETDTMNEKEQFQAVITALIDHFTLWDHKNHLDFSQVNPINSSAEELKQILRYILAQLTVTKPDEESLLKYNETLEFPSQSDELLQLANDMLKMQEVQDLNLDLENLYANILQISKMVKDQENKSYAEDRMNSGTDQLLNNSNSNVDSLYSKKISDLDSMLYSNSTNFS